MKRSISLDLEAIYGKLVERRRGGYCYELNGLFNLLLESLGFKTTLLSGRVRRDDGTYGPEFDHMVILVSLDQEYLVDVGFGDSCRKPVPMTGEVIADTTGKYRVKIEENDQTLFQKETSRGWETHFSFTLRPRRMEDFQETNIYQQTSPESHFTKSTICSIATENGRVTVSGNELIVTNGQKRTERVIDNDSDMKSILYNYFCIRIDS